MAMFFIVMGVSSVASGAFFHRYFKKIKSNTIEITNSSLLLAFVGVFIATASLCFGMFQYMYPLELPRDPEIYIGDNGVTMKAIKNGLINGEEIYYTLDGQDPSSSETAFKYSGEEIHVPPNAILIVRTKANSKWGEKKVFNGLEVQELQEARTYYLGANELDPEPMPADALKVIKEQSKDEINKYRRTKIGADSAVEVTLDADSLNMKAGERGYLTATVTPAAYKDAPLGWTSSNPDVATIDNGEIVAVSPGETEITVSYSSEISAKCTVSVSPSDENKTPALKRPTIQEGIQNFFSNPQKQTQDTKAPEIIKLNGEPEKTTEADGSKLPSIITDSPNQEPNDVPSVTTNKKVKVTGISLTPEKTINVGEQSMLAVEFFPENATNKPTKWKSSNNDIVKVNEHGVILGLKGGTATVTVTAGGISETCAVTVNELIIPLEAVTIRNVVEGVPFELEVGSSMRVRYDTIPANATVKYSGYEILDTAIASVDQNGNVVAKSEGTTTVVVSAGEYKATCTVKVVPAVFVDRIILCDSNFEVLKNIEMLKGSSYRLTAVIEPAEASKKKVDWISSDTAVATVKDGLVTANKPGDVIITAAIGSTTAECRIKINEVPVESVALSASDVELSRGKTMQLSYEVYPPNADVNLLRWKSSDEKVVKVEDGNIIAVREGTATITLTVNKQITGQCVVTVTPLIYDSFIFSDDIITVEVDSSRKLNYTVKPSLVDPRAIEWTTSNPQIATVIDGIVQGHSEGSVWITATLGDLREFCRVNVVATPVREIYLGESRISLEIGDITQLNYEIQPAKAANRKVQISSDNEGVAKVSSNGLIYAQGEGTARVSISADGVQASCLVEVHPVSPKTITLDIHNLEMEPGDQETIGIMLQPIQAETGMIRWRTSNASVLSVDENGTVTALRDGMVNVVAYYGNVSDSCTIKVKRKIVQAEDILLPEMDSTINAGEVWELTAVVVPEDTTDKALNWNSDNPEVIWVSQSGKIQALSSGTATVAVSCGDVKKSFTLNVPQTVVKAEDILLPEMDSTINAGEMWELTAVVVPNNATDKVLSWTSDNTGVIWVDQSGKIQALASGAATVTVSCGDVKKSFTLNVPQAVVVAENILLPELPSTIGVGETWEITAVVVPDSATDKSLSWSSDNPGVIWVDQSGKIQALAPGTATVTVSCGDIQKSFTLNVPQTVVEAENILLPELPATINLGEVWQLSPVVTPSTATDQVLTWVSSQPSVVFVDQAGNIQALAKGETIITVYCGKIQKSFALNVT